MTPFALFRLPFSQHVTLVQGPVSMLNAHNDLSRYAGFVMAPFATTPDEPIMLISGQPHEIADSGQLPAELSGEWVGGQACMKPAGTLCSSGRDDYHIDFLNFHAHLINGDFQKLVLSRQLEVDRSEADQPLTLFDEACRRYPRMFIALVYTPQSGIWLTATPEILLEGTGRTWQTIALAGTMLYADDMVWSDKNRQEQRYVATFITQQLERYTSDFTEEGPYTARAGHLAHLRSDFRFTLSDSSGIGELINALHPSPAVSGLPKTEAVDFIRQYERHSRAYYSGYMGPLQLPQVDGDAASTHLFVTLRCMQVMQDCCRLYAGGGLLADSVEEQEWQETEAKLDTMRRLLAQSSANVESRNV